MRLLMRSLNVYLAFINRTLAFRQGSVFFWAALANASADFFEVGIR